jgi:hypothetical protein
MRQQLFLLVSLFLDIIQSDIIRDNIQRVKDENHEKYLDEFQHLYIQKIPRIENKRNFSKEKNNYISDIHDVLGLREEIIDIARHLRFE